MLPWHAQIVAHATETRNVVATCCGTELLKTLLPHLTEQLELCQKSLTAYLETKRAEFPRFYFVSDPTLLEILSLGSDPPAVVPHFQSGLFDSLTSVTFDKVGALSCCSWIVCMIRASGQNSLLRLCIGSIRFSESASLLARLPLKLTCQLHQVGHHGQQDC